jgi:nicotinamide mononucleotide transporter
MFLFDIQHIAFEIWGYPVSYVELLGTLFGLASVYFASRTNILTWPTGIVNEVFLFVLFFQVQLYAEMFLQVYFLVVTVYGWYRWRRKTAENRITSTRLTIRLGLLATIAIGTVLAGMLLRNIHLYLPAYFKIPAAYPFADSFVMVCSILATVLLAQKKWETWLLWLAVDVVSVVMYFMLIGNFASNDFYMAQW